MSRRAFRIITVVAALILLGGMTSADEQTREFAVSAGGTLELNLEAGGSVVVRGDGGSKITVTYEIDQNSTIEFRESSNGLEIVTRSETVFLIRASSSSPKAGKQTPRCSPTSEIYAASPPEQLMETTELLPSGPPT